MKFVPVTAFAALLVASPVLAAGALTYDDPGMHFAAPAGWQRVEVPAGDDAAGAHKPPAAVFTLAHNASDVRSIVVDIQQGEDSLESFERQAESDVHSGSGDARVDKRERVTLANGMPAYLLQISSGDGLSSVRRYEYLVFDGERDITVTYAGHEGTFDRKDAVDALSSLYVVAYPRGRS